MKILKQENFISDNFLNELKNAFIFYCIYAQVSSVEACQVSTDTHVYKLKKH